MASGANANPYWLMILLNAVSSNTHGRWFSWYRPPTAHGPPPTSRVSRSRAGSIVSAWAVLEMATNDVVRSAAARRPDRINSSPNSRGYFPAMILVKRREIEPVFDRRAPDYIVREKWLETARRGSDRRPLPSR